MIPNNLTPTTAAQAYNSLRDTNPILWQLQNQIRPKEEIEWPLWSETIKQEDERYERSIAGWEEKNEPPEDASENDEVERGEE